VYEFLIKPEEESNIKFSDGEVESVTWYTKNEILCKIKKDENITADSVEVFKYYLDKSH
jgi:NADH pyrophosphatase NudC (nudix superfamily)